MNKQYYSAQEISELIGMSKAGVLKRANKEQWEHQPRKGKGGGKEFHIDSLPEEARSKLAKQAAEAIAESSKLEANQAGKAIAQNLLVRHKLDHAQAMKNRQQLMAKIAHLTGVARQRPESKIIILTMWQSFVRNSAEVKTRATEKFLMLWREGMLIIPEDEQWIKQYINKNLTSQTLYGWEKAIVTNPSKIWGNYGNRKGTSKIDRQEPLREFVIATICEYPHISAVQLHKAVEVRFETYNQMVDKEEQIDIPAKRSLERWVKTYKAENAQAYTAITNPDKWKNKYMPAFGTVGVAALNEKWELDSTPADIMLADGRYNLLGAIDVYSRRAKLIVSKSSTAASVAKLLRDCMLEWGVPETVKTDNGADYVSVQIKTAFQGLGIHQDISAPFSPWEKPHIERFFRTFSHGLLELMPGFIGHNVAERSVIEDRKQFSDRLFKKGEIIEVNMTSQDLQKFVDDWLEHSYMHTSHTGEGIDGQTPYQMVANWTAPIQTIENERALDILLAEAGERTVGKDGIRLDGFTYIAPELGVLVTERVQIRKDPQDIGKIHVFKDGEFICVAEDARYVGITRQEIAYQGKQNSLKNINAAKKQIRSMKSKQKVKDIADEIMEAQRAKANVTMLPKQTETYSNDFIEAAAEAAAETTVVKAIEPAKPTRATVSPVSTNPQDVYRRWLRLEQQINNGQSLTQSELKWFESYQKTPEYTDMKEFFEDFGLGLETGSK